MPTKKRRTKKPKRNYKMDNVNDNDNPRAKAEQMFRYIMNGDLNSVRSVLSSDSYIVSHLDVVYIDLTENDRTDTFLSYAIKRNQPLIVKELLIAGSPITQSLKNMTDNLSIIAMLEIYENHNLSREEKRRMVNQPITSEKVSLNDIRRIRRERQQLANIISDTSTMSLSSKKGGSRHRQNVNDSFIDSMSNMKISKKVKKKSSRSPRRYRRVTSRQPIKKYNKDLSKYVDDLLNVGEEYIGSVDNLADALDDANLDE